MEVNKSEEIRLQNEYKIEIKSLEKFKKYSGSSYKEIQSLINYIKSFKVEIEKKLPGIMLNIKSIDDGNVEEFYKALKKEPFNEECKNSLTISPQVLNKMNKDRDYALKIISAIISIARPKTFDDFLLDLYEYHIFVKDNGKIEVVYSSDPDYKKMRKKIDKLKRAKRIRKAAIKKRIAAVKCMIYSRYLYENRKLQLLNREYVKKSYMPYEYYLSQNSELKRLIFSLLQ